MRKAESCSFGALAHTSRECAIREQAPCLEPGSWLASLSEGTPGKRVAGLIRNLEGVRDITGLSPVLSVNLGFRVLKGCSVEWPVSAM